MFNDFISEYTLDIPNTLFDLFSLSDLSLSYFDHYIQLGLTPTFIPLSQRKGYIPKEQTQQQQQISEVAFLQWF